MAISRILILNGPNLNLLGQREVEIYGHTTLDDIKQAAIACAHEHKMEVDFRQSNHEGQLVDWIHEGRKMFDAIIINAGAYSHTSIAILDALKAAGRPIIEVHLSNIFAREEFRHHSYVSQAAKGVICGFGAAGYLMAIKALAGGAVK